MAELGDLRQTHGVRWERYAALLVLSNVLVLIWAVMVLTGRLTLPTFLMMFILVKTLVAMKLVPATARRVEVYDRGLRVHELGYDVEVPWDSLESLYLAVLPRMIPLPGEQPVARTLRLDARERLVSLPDDLEDFDELVRLACARVDEQVAPELERQFDQGETVSFGPVKVSRAEGLATQDWYLSFANLQRAPDVVRPRPWSELDQVTVSAGFLYAGPETMVPLALIPNPHVLARLLARQGVPVRGLDELLGGTPAATVAPPEQVG